MPSRTRKIDDLIAVLEKTGAEPQRLEVLRRTQRFKRSWVDLAEVLVDVRRDESYTRWGYEDLYTYCQQELSLRKATVDKLTLSYNTLRKHAPQILERDNQSRMVPSYQAVDYFQRVAEPANDTPSGKRPLPKKVLDELRTAVFDEGQPVSELRKRFDPVVRPKSPAQQRLSTLEQASRMAHKLAALLPDIDGLSETRVRKLEGALGKLREELEDLAAPLREEVGAARRKRPPRPAASR